MRPRRRPAFWPGRRCFESGRVRTGGCGPAEVGWPGSVRKARAGLCHSTNRSESAPFRTAPAWPNADASLNRGSGLP
ncbi:CxxxxCH/CxxCH domain-containing protein [Microvirga sp. BT325]|uniref:CxxxxCH/CxxCH domain-containing protein n=1 Tax=Microvirga splendida TaxID=2795727 RepID=A0ABS0Y7G9_9HYPH|nr:CxxxxCH/CxxCH domain-containing protein [Microvirga splendida]